MSKDDILTADNFEKLLKVAFERQHEIVKNYLQIHTESQIKMDKLTGNNLLEFRERIINIEQRLAKIEDALRNYSQ